MNAEPNVPAVTTLVVAVGEMDEVTRTVLAAAIKLASRAPDVRVNVVHVVDLLPGAEGAIRSPDGTYPGAAELHQRGGARLDEARRMLEQALGREVKSHLEFGSPSAQVIDVARREHADFLVLGAVDRSLWKRIVFGSTAEALLRHAPCSLVLARTPKP